jgi:hypothetical protein
MIRFFTDYTGDRPMLFWPAFLNRLSDKGVLYYAPRFKSTFTLKINNANRKK